MKRILGILLVTAILIMTCACTALGEGETKDAKETGTYADVAADAWYADAVKTLSESGIMNGTGGGRFSPGGTFTRAQLVTVLYRMAGEPDAAADGGGAFTDVADGQWYSDAVSWAAAEGVVSGYGNGLFGTNDPVTQEQMAVMLYRRAGEPNTETAADDASDWARAAVGWARQNGIAAGQELDFSPGEAASRAQVAVMTARFMALEAADPQESGNGGTEAGSDNANDVLIIYFSAANTKDVDAVTAATPLIDSMGATEWMANEIHKKTGGDIVKIVPSVDYPLAYNDLADYAKDETDKNARPAFEALSIDPSSYKTVYIGYPVWWYTLPMVMETFFDTYDMTGVTIVPFNTHEGSRDGGTYDLISQREPGAEVLEGLPIRGGDTGSGKAASQISEWIEGLPLK